MEAGVGGNEEKTVDIPAVVIPTRHEPTSDLATSKTRQEEDKNTSSSDLPERTKPEDAQLASTAAQIFIRLLHSLERLSQLQNGNVAIVAVCAMFFGFLMFMVLLIL